MKATITSYRYYKSDSYVSRGNKKHDYPDNTIKLHGVGITSNPPRVIVCYETESGACESVDMYETIKYNSNCHRITEKYVGKLMRGVLGRTIDTDQAYDDILQLMAPYIE